VATLRRICAENAQVVRGFRLAKNSQQTYGSAVLQYARWAEMLHLQKPFPATDAYLSEWLVFQSQTCSPDSLKVYMNAIRDFHLHRELTFQPVRGRPSVVATLQGLKRLHGAGSRRKLAITRKVLFRMHGAAAAYATGVGIGDSLMAAVWAATLVAFFGMLRKDNVTVNKADAFNTHIHLRRCDVFFQQTEEGEVMWLNLRHSKTNQFGERSHRLAIYPTGGSLCPVAAVRHLFETVPGEGGAHAFAFTSRGKVQPLTHTVFVRHLKGLLHSAGCDPASYSGHSLRRGGATLAFRLGMSMEQIMEHGDWRSLAVMVYNEVCAADRQRLPRRLAAACSTPPV